MRFKSLPRAPESRSRGQALVELALIMPFLMLLAVGTIELGRAFLALGTVEAGAYRGAVYSAFARANALDQAAIRETVVADWGPLPLSSTNPTVTVVVGQESLACRPTAFPCPTQPSDSVGFDTVQIVVAYELTPLMSWPGVPSIPILRSSVAMRIQP
jgi:hypothetical protein